VVLRIFSKDEEEKYDNVYCCSLLSMHTLALHIVVFIVFIVFVLFYVFTYLTEFLVGFEQNVSVHYVLISIFALVIAGLVLQLQEIFFNSNV